MTTGENPTVDCVSIQLFIGFLEIPPPPSTQRPNRALFCVKGEWCGKLCRFDPAHLETLDIYLPCLSRQTKAQTALSPALNRRDHPQLTGNLYEVVKVELLRPKNVLINC